MVSRTLAALIVTVIVGSVLAYFGITYLRNRMAHNEAIQNTKRDDISITVVEGKRREEIALQLEQLGITPYVDFLQASADKEGYLFPDTYRFFPNTPADVVVAKMIATFDLRTKNERPGYDDVILASIIEREAQNDSERAIIAGIYVNRLSRGMMLEADPTVQYGKDSNAFSVSADPKTLNFWADITRADYQAVDSPFNTYRTKGLPPAPIANPGLKSIEASQHPAQHSYIYFAHRDGQLLLSTTLAEHEAKLRSFAR